MGPWPSTASIHVLHVASYVVVLANTRRDHTWLAMAGDDARRKGEKARRSRGAHGSRAALLLFEYAPDACILSKRVRARTQPAQSEE